MIAAMHPGSAIATTSSNYLRNVDGGVVKAVSASDCTGALSAGRPARSTTCAAHGSAVSQLSFLNSFDDVAVTADSKCNNLVLAALPTCAITPSTATASFTLSGAVTDYGTAEKAAIQKVVAGAAGVPLSSVTITISSGSVVVVATIEVATSTAATTVQGALTSGIMASANALETALTAEPALATFTVEAAPTVAVAERVVPSPPADDTNNLPLIIGFAVLGAAVLALVTYLMLFKKKGTTNAKKAKTNNPAGTAGSVSSSSSA
jgi:hypothetical protein